ISFCDMIAKKRRGKTVKYRIGELAGLVGCSSDLIRYYERIGLLNPVYGHNGYRVYDDNDLFTLLRVRIMRGLDFPLEIIAGEKKPAEREQEYMNAFLTDKLDELGRDIDMLQNRLTRLQTVFNTSKECAIYLNKVVPSVVPATYRLPLGKSFQDATVRAVRSWMKRSEYVLTAYHIPARSLYEEGPLPVQGGLSMLKTNADRCDVFIDAPVVFYPRKGGLMTILTMRDPAKATREELSPLLGYANENECSLTGELYLLDLAVSPAKTSFHYVKVHASTL
ncbi:MAG TPA: MerR family transcriptional regulator, partial [Terriglobales bacterium]|nr:MerR family transcriptional regulator [Terriglobales bacterium]